MIVFNISLSTKEKSLLPKMIFTTRNKLLLKSVTSVAGGNVSVRVSRLLELSTEPSVAI